MTWLNDKYIKEWLQKIHSERTKQNYKREFPLYLEFVQQNTKYKTPSQIIESRIEHLTSRDLRVKRFWEDIGIQYMHSLEGKGYRKNTIVTYLRTMLSFFSQNHVKLTYARKELIGAVEPSPKDKVIKEWIPSNEDVRLLYRVAQNSRDRAILLMMYQSGLSPVDVCLNIEQLDFYDKDGNWKIPLNEDYYLMKLREKTNVLQQTCISREALEEIRITLQQRGFPKKGSLFVTVHNKPITPRDINDILKGIVERAYGKERVKKWKTKNLRDSYMNGLVMAKIQQDVKDAMCGHQRSGAKKEYDFTEQTIKSLYSEAFRFLTINGFGSTSRKVEELENKMRQDKETLVNLITEQQNRIEQLETKLANNTKEILETLNEFSKKAKFKKKR
jgi:site-specific recombinase XerD